MRTRLQTKVKTRKPRINQSSRPLARDTRCKPAVVFRRNAALKDATSKSQLAIATTARPNYASDGLRHPTKLERQVWSVVLAGGEGERLRPLMTRWLGYHRPKQYCTFVGNHSMLWHTLNRAQQLTGIERTLIVVAAHHEPWQWDRMESHHEKTMITQPCNRDTAPGIFLPLTHIATRDPEATVVILPSDHFVHPQETFLAAGHRAIRAVECHPEKLILLGVRPDTAETEYGWIQPGPTVGSVEGHVICQVAGFREKPGVTEARHLLRSGGLWNTMVITVRLPTLWKLGWRCFPAIMEHFTDFAAIIGTDKETHVLDSLYNTIPPANFSTDVLQPSLDSLAVMELRGVLWSDWGSERRIVETLERIGKTPLFENVTMNSPTRSVSTL